MPMREKREVHHLSGYLIERAVWGAPLPIVCLEFEQTIAGISISFHFRTVVANSNNFQVHPVCNLLSTNEINPGENIFNNNVMQNGISKIVKSGRFSQLLLKIGRSQPHYTTQGVEYPAIYSHTTWYRRIDVIVQNDRSTSQSDLVGSRIL